MSTKRPAKSLIAKLTAACEAIGYVEKSGRNEYQHYNYVKATDVARVVRKEFFKRGIFITQSEKEFTETGRVITNKGGEMREFKLMVEFTIHDADSDQKIVTQAIGVAMDSGDKAIYKAKTGALKYFLRGLGMIPDERDDPEADESVDEDTDARIGQDPPKDKKQKKVADFQCRAFHSACDKSGKTAAQVAVYLKEKFQVATVADLSREHFNDAIKWALGKEELTDTLKTSLDAVTRKKANGAEPEPTESRRYEAI